MLLLQNTDYHRISNVTGSGAAKIFVINCRKVVNMELYLIRTTQWCIKSETYLFYLFIVELDTLIIKASMRRPSFIWVETTSLL